MAMYSDSTSQPERQAPGNASPVQLYATPIPLAADAKQQQESEGHHVILYRSPHFFVRTTVRPGPGRAVPLRRTSEHTAVLPWMAPVQKQYMAERETKLMPSVAPINPPTKKQFPIPGWLEAAFIMLGLLPVLITHAFNMFNYPRYELDEGTYMASAWAILHGMITPYAYGYGHPPLAWIQIAAWVELIGGFFNFGDAINTGRVTMLLYTLGSSLLVYLIVRRLGSSRSAGLVAMLIFALSPLAITYQRQVLLDNVGTFWLLLSLYLLTVSNSRLLLLVLAGLSLGIAILSKEIFVLFIPVMIYMAWLHSTKFQRKFALVAFTYSVVAFSSAYVLMAVLKGELFPHAWLLPGDNHPHLSLIDTYVQQFSRSGSEGNFLQQWQVWTQLDPLLMLSSMAAVGFNLIVGWWKRMQLLLALMAISFWILLIRGGVVFAFYIIPMIPLAAINVAFALMTVAGWLGKLMRFDLVRVVLLLGMIAVIVPFDIAHSKVDFTQNPTTAQVQAIAWVHEHVPHKAFIVISDWMFVDLREAGGAGASKGGAYPLANVYYNVATDPAVYGSLLANNWDRIDYVADDLGMDHDIHSDPTKFKIILDALGHSVPVARFTASSGANIETITIYKVIHKFPPGQ